MKIIIDQYLNKNALALFSTHRLRPHFPIAGFGSNLSPFPCGEIVSCTGEVRRKQKYLSASMFSSEMVEGQCTSMNLEMRMQEKFHFLEYIKLNAVC